MGKCTLSQLSSPAEFNDTARRAKTPNKPGQSRIVAFRGHLIGVSQIVLKPDVTIDYPKIKNCWRLWDIPGMISTHSTP